MLFAKNITPIHLESQGGWVMSGYSKDYPKFYVYRNPAYKNHYLKIQVKEEIEPFSFLAYSIKKKKTSDKFEFKKFIVSIVKNTGDNISRHEIEVEIRKDFSEIFQNEDIKRYLDFFESLEKNDLENSENEDSRKSVYEWFAGKLKNKTFKWYSDYGCAIHDETFPLDDCIHDLITIKTTRRNKKTYVEFSEPIGKFREQK